ncbi:MAG TPA: hypothetical protein VNO32_37135 [Candidatus Acidoferrum sp.]|nr:hypothetical protein [Candidatus Acidoferrum sp.]
MFRKIFRSTLCKAVLATAVLGGTLFFAGTPKAEADQRDRLRYDNDRLHEAIVHRGFYSPRADYWRIERREAFARGYYDRFGRWHRY